MLVVSRHEGESIDITDTVTGARLTVKVTTIKGNRVRVGIDAPQRFAVRRSEIDNGTARRANNEPPRDQE